MYIIYAQKNRYKKIYELQFQLYSNAKVAEIGFSFFAHKLVLHL